jgi:spore coat polysaccharide biosynthesis protein SpsF
MKVILIVQARVGSTRLPGKAFLDVCGKPLIERVIERVILSQKSDTFILAVPDTPENDVFKSVADAYRVSLFRGSEHDLIDRFYQAALRSCESSDAIVRVCADNPFIAPEEIDRLITFFKGNTYDYAFNHIPAAHNSYPDGLGAEIMKFSVLKKLWERTSRHDHREHVSQYIWENITDFCVGIIKAPLAIAYPDIKLDVDTQDDLDLIRHIYRELLAQGADRIFSAEEIVRAAICVREKNAAEKRRNDHG